MALNTHEQILETVHKSNKTLITFRKNFSIDSLSSAISLFLMFKKLNKPADIACDGFVMPSEWMFLPRTEIRSALTDLRQFIVGVDIKKTGVDQFSYNVEGDKLNIFITPKQGSFIDEDVKTFSSQYKYDHIIIVDTPDRESLGTLYEKNVEFFLHTPTTNIDHSPANEQFGHINLIDTTAVATSEIVYQFLKSSDAKMIDQKIAHSLLSGMIGKTRSFKTGNITPKSLMSAKELIELGGDRQEIIQNLYRKQTISTLQLWGKILSRLKTNDSGTLVWSTISEHDFTKSFATPKDLVGITEEIISTLPKAEVIVFIYRIKGSVTVRIEVYKNQNAMRLARHFSPIGDRSIVEFPIPDSTLADAEQVVTSHLIKELSQEV